MIAAYKQIKHAPTVYEIIMINKCFEIISSYNLYDRKEINQVLKTDIFSTFSNKIKEMAKIKYYKKFNL